MAQVLVTKVNEWYQGIASLRNLPEKKLELRFLKCAAQVFRGYHVFQSAFTMNSANSSETAGPDVLLIAEDFSQWCIVELELTGKPLNHTRKQLRVFSRPKYDEDKLALHCIDKCEILRGKEEELKKMFSATPPSVLVVFDTYHKRTIDTVSHEFDCQICVLEVYKTVNHDLELYRLSGDYPYIYTEFCYLKNVVTNPDMYGVARPELFDNIGTGNIKVYYKNMEISANIFKSRNKLYLKIPENPLDPGSDLKIFKSFNNKLIIEKL